MRLATIVTAIWFLCGTSVSTAQESPRPEALILQTLQRLEEERQMVRILDLHASLPAYENAIRRVGQNRGMIVSGRDDLLQCPENARFIEDCGLPFDAGTVLMGFGKIESVSPDTLRLPVMELFPFGEDSVRELHFDVIFEKDRGSAWRIVDILVTLVT